MSEMVEQPSDLTATEPDSSLAFTHVLAFARKVAHELEAARVPQDEWLVQEYRPPRAAEQFGLHELGDSVPVPTPERREGIGGWRVFGALLEEHFVADAKGERVGPDTGRRVNELWLLQTGELRDVLLTTDATGATTATRTAVDPRAVTDLVREPVWAEERTRVHGRARVRRYRTDTDSGAVDAAHALSQLLAALRRRAH